MSASEWVRVRGLQGAVSQNIKTFITTAVRTLNPASQYSVRW
jgi:hypothetical protein